MAGVFKVRRGSPGYELDWDGDTVIIKAIAAAQRGIDQITERMADLARIDHEWINRTFQTELSVYVKPAIVEWNGRYPHVWGEWGVEARPRFDEETQTAAKVNTKDVALFLEFGTAKMRAYPWLYPAWDALKGEVLPTIASFYRGAGGFG